MKSSFTKILSFVCLFILSACFSFTLFPVLHAAPLPLETSHTNSNTYSNLNTLTNTENITFNIAYDTVGDIKWYKDGVLIQTDSSATSASLTTSWTGEDYGQVKELKVNSTTIDGTSTDTVWKVEVEETGTGMIAKHTEYPQPRIGGQYTLYVTNGWTNLSSLYLATKQEDNTWIEYVKARTYIVKHSIAISGATLNIDYGNVKDVYLQGLPALNSDYIVQIRASNNGTIIINGVNFYGWDSEDSQELTATNVSPIVASDGNNRMDITNSNFRHVRIHYNVDKSAGDIVRNNTFFEGKPDNMWFSDGYGDDTSKGQIITDNYFVGAGENFSSGRGLDSLGTLLKDNKFVAQSAGNILPGQGTYILGNELVFSDWNLIEFPNNAFAKYNNLHDNGGHHNGFNGVRNAYSVNDYCHNFTGYACWYLQVAQPNINNPLTWYASSRGYIINGYSKGVTGINILGGIDNYFYNGTSDNSAHNIQYNSDRNVFRKFNFSNSNPAIKLVDPTDVDLNDYGFVHGTYLIDSQFSYTNVEDIRFQSSIEKGGNPILYSINSFRKNSDGTIQIPTVNIYNVFGGGEVRNLAYLDALAQDQTGAPVSGATITITPYVMTPTFSIAGGSYSSSQGVSLNSATFGATIYYTTDGTDPATSDTRLTYSSSLSISSTTTIKAVATKTGYIDSDVTTATYTIAVGAYSDAPILSLAPGAYYSAQDITITSTTPGATIYYTINGSTPTSASTLYTSPVHVAQTTTVKAVAVAPDHITSGAASVTYYIYTGVIYSTASDNYPVKQINLPPPPQELNGFPAENLPIPTAENFTSIVTGADGHIASPNYGWSANVEATPALLFYWQNRGASNTINTTGYRYRITATYNNESVSTVVTPDASWYREDPTQPAKTVILTFDKDVSKSALNINSGTGSGIYTPGEIVPISAGTAPTGKIFEKWLGDTTGITDINSANTTLTIQANDASLTPYYKDITYHLTVNGGEGSGDYPAGKIVVADATPTSGEQVFYQWTGNTEDMEHIISPAVYSSTLTMPDHDVTVTATYRNPISYSCHLTVAEGEGTDFYAPGDNVSISANTSQTGKVFDHWEGDTENLADINAASTTLSSIPDSYSIVYPVYKNISVTAHNLALTNATTGGGAYEPGETVSISAQDAPVGKTFDVWTGDVSCLSDAGASTATVTIPDSDIALTAAYKDLPLYTLNVTGGSGSGSYYYGRPVSIIADSAAIGKVFDKWTGDIQYVSDANLAYATVIMPAGAVSLTATYKNTPVAATPVFSLASGNYSSAQIVSLSSTTPGATIHYTLNGTSPTSASSLYTSPITISSATTVKAIAMREGYADSLVATATYTIGASSGSGGSGGGGSSTHPKPKPREIKITGVAGNSVSLSLTVDNASQMILSDNSSFTGASWETYQTSKTYTKKDSQTKLYLKFKSSYNVLSDIVTLDIPVSGSSGTSLYPTGTLLKTPTSFKTYVMINGKKKWIPTPEVFEQLGYKWSEIKTLTDTELNAISDYEDNLIRTLGDYKVYLVVNGVKRHIPDPQVFLNYGFSWQEVKDVEQSVVDKYKDTYLLKQSGSDGIYYVNSLGIRKLIPSDEVFKSYNDKYEEVQVISGYEMGKYPLSNLIKLGGSNDIYLVEGNIKKRISSPEVFNKYRLNWNLVMNVNQTEFNFYADGRELR